jgi:diacylglycerol kinase (ATP)
VTAPAGKGEPDGFRCSVLVLNPKSRNGADDSLADIVDTLLDLGPVHACRVDETDTAAELIREFGSPETRVILGGGDGTLAYLLDAILETGSTLGVLPLGTANDFARSLEIPHNVDDALAVIRAGRVRHVDVGEVNGETFLNAVGVGLGPELTRELDAEAKSQLGVLAYPVSLLSVLSDAEAFHVRLTVDGSTHEFDGLQVTIGNGIHYGGGMTIAHDARLDNGQLAVLCIQEQSKLHLAGQAIAVRNGETDDMDDLLAFSGSEVHLETDSALPATADGELITETPLRCRSRPRALRVLAPATRTGAESV